MLIYLLLIVPPIILTSELKETVFHVQENVDSQYLVGSLRRLGAQSFTVTNNVPEFTVDRRYGDIRVAKTPDREIKDRFELTVVIVFDNSKDSPDTAQVANVVIIITDVNDNAPLFTRKLIPMTITESQPVGFKIPLDAAEDPDLGTNSTQNYEIVSKDVPFRLKPPSLGFDNMFSFNLELVRPLDREVVDNYVIDIVASDGGNPPKSDKMTLQIKVADVNDNTPQFNQSIYRPRISEDAVVGSVVCAVLATDHDMGDNAAINYLIEPRFNKAELFSIDPQSGVITLAGPLDRETTDTHHLVVRATDSGQFPERTTVRVSVSVLDVNDNSPEISITFLSQDDKFGMVSEASSVGDYVAHVNVRDKDVGDNGAVQLTLISEGAPFSITPVGAGYAVQVSGPLDRESRDLWKMRLEARDGGKPVRVQSTDIIVRVVDVNDCPPVFQEQIFKCNVSEIAEKGTDIVKVSATDQDLGVNAQISYSIVKIASVGGNNGNNADVISFSINSESGVITTGSQLDREARESVELTVEATDGGSPSLSSRCTVVVDIIDYNDNDPRFDQRHYTTVIPEDTPIGSEVLSVLATDADSGGATPLTYSIKEYYSAARSIFAIDPETGVISTLAPLDYEEQKSYNLVVEAHDNGGRRGVTSVEVLLRDLNDNSPQFSQKTYKASLLLTVLPGTIATRVAAFDVDSGVNGVVSYSILQGGEKFDIDPSTGFISTTVSLNGLTNVTERVTVEARDGGAPQKSSFCSVLILIGSLSTIDLKPVFVSKEYTVDISEGVSPGYAIMTVFAKSTDSDYKGEIKYALSHLTRHAHDSFTIDEVSGSIQTVTSLDREENEVHAFVVEATDELGRQGMAAVRVSVTDVNDNKARFSAPNYHFSILENVDEGAQVAQITASDLDYGINGLVQYLILSPEDVPFRVNPLTGTITVTGMIDFEEKTQYKMRIKAYNRVTTNFYQETNVKISIVDVNDNPPRFLQDSFRLSVLDSSLEDASVGVVMATDGDSGRNGELFYTLQPTQYSHLFEIDLKTGEVRTAGIFANKGDLLEQYTLKVLCRDRGQPSLNATVMVTVDVVTAGDVVNMLQKVLKNDVISLKAKYLIIFLAVAFALSLVTLLCFVRYHRADKSKYRNAVRYEKVPPSSNPPSLPPKSSDNLYSLSGCEMAYSSDTLHSKPLSSCHGNYPGYKVVECGSYCPSIPETKTSFSPDLISTSFFSERLKLGTSAESLPPLTSLQGTLPRVSKMEGSKDSLSHRFPHVRSEAALNYDIPSCSRAQKHCHDKDYQDNNANCGYNPANFPDNPANCQDNPANFPDNPANCQDNPAHFPDNPPRCHSNESGVGSGHGSTPPTSETNFLKNDATVRKEGWLSSEDSLFKVINPVASLQSLTGQKVNLNDKRQVRFQKAHDSFV